ncbi:MAG TPA: hypothetical protein VGI58_15035 [Streptosporangiaceae bacterium]|jgi:hypothetical protein
MLGDGKWSELDSENERLIRVQERSSSHQASSPEALPLAGLTSQGERTAASPLPGLASPGRPKAGLRLVASAA